MRAGKIFYLTSVLLAASIYAFAQDKPKDEFNPSGKVWGYAFGDFYYKAAGDSDQYLTFGKGDFAKKKKNDMAFTFKRIYLGYEYNISPKLKTNFLLEGNDGVVTATGSRTVFVKNLDLEWKSCRYASIYIGQTITPTWPMISEKIWTYRSVEKTIADFRGLGVSNDLGIRVTGKLDTAGVFGYTVMLGNGGKGGNVPEADALKKIYGSLDFSLLKKKLIIQVQGDYEDVTAAYGGGYASKKTMLGFISYQAKIFTIGLEGVYQIQDKAKVNTDASSGLKDTLGVAPMGISFFVRGTLLKDKINAFARFDIYNIDANYKKGDNTANPYDENFILAGVDFTPHKNWHIIPNVWVDTYKDKRDSNEAGYHARTADIVPRITFHYIFK